MDKYAIYSYEFETRPIQGDLFANDNKPSSAKTDEERRVWFDRMFGERKTEVRMERTVPKTPAPKTTKFPTVVMAHSEMITLLRVVNPKMVSYWEEREALPGEIKPIDKRTTPSSPFCYVVIDCRKDKNLIAIEIDGSAWRDTDVLAKIMQESVNAMFERSQLGFAIKIKPQNLPYDFVEQSKYYIKRKKLGVTKMTVYFTRGCIDPKVAEIIRNDAYLRHLEKKMFKSKTAEITYTAPDAKRIVDERSKVLEHLVTLIHCSSKDLFRLRLSYDNGVTLSCGKDMRMEFEMDAIAFMTMLSYEYAFPGHLMGDWLDNISEEIKGRRE